MFKRALGAGLVGGILISLAGLYPMVSLLAPLWLAGWERPFTNELIHVVWLAGSAVLGVPVALGLGVWAANRAQAVGWRQGVVAGGLAAAAAALASYGLLLLPARALFGYGRLLPAPANFANGTFAASAANLLAFLAQPVDRLALQPEWLLAGLALFWVVQGALQGWRRRRMQLAERPSLLALLHNNQPLKDWFAGDETAVRLGLTTGGLVSFLLVVVGLIWLLQTLPQNFQAGPLGQFVQPLTAISPLFAPVFLLILVNFGFFTVLLLKNPVTRWRARITAVWLAALVVAITAVFLLLHLFYLLLAGAFVWAETWLIANPELAEESVAVLQRIEVVFQNPGSLIATVVLAPWFAVLAALALALLLGGWQALLVLPVLTLRRCPVDRAAHLRRQLRHQPDELLPVIYELFDQTPQAYDVLAHLAVQTQQSQPAVAALAAGLHTLGRSPQPQQQAVAAGTVGDLLAKQRGWRWAADLGGIYQTLQQALAAQTLEEIDVISPPPALENAALPEVVVQNGRLLERVLNALHKIKRAKDHPTRLIFLENAQTAVNEAQSFVQASLAPGASGRRRAPLPQQPALANVFARWHDLLLAASQELKGRADLVLTLQTRHSRPLPELPLLCRVQNVGLNAARQLRLQALPGEGYFLLGIKSEASLQVLPAGEQQTLTVTLVPEAGRPQIRVSFELRFDDAAGVKQRQYFADVVEFSREERPFLPIQPNPYQAITALNPTDYSPVAFLSTSEMQQLIEAPVAAFNVEYDPLAVERIINVTAGHPALAQLLLHELVQYHNQMAATYLTSVDVDQVVERIVQQGDAHFGFIWADGSEEEQEVLLAVATLGSGGEAVGVREMRQFLGQRGNVSADRWQTALDSLESRDILVRQNGRNPLYRFRVELIRYWIGQKRPSE